MYTDIQTVIYITGTQKCLYRNLKSSLKAVLNWPWMGCHLIQCTELICDLPLAVRIKTKKWQLAMHCHLRPPISTVVLGFDYNALVAPAYQISAQAGNAWRS